MLRFLQRAMVLFLIIAQTLPLVAQAEYRQFADVEAGNSNVDAIYWLADNDIVQGYADGTFGVQQCVSRAEFLKMLFLTMQYDTAGLADSSKFSDVKSADWFAPYVNASVSLGAVQGYGDNTFRPNQCITSNEALKIVIEQRHHEAFAAANFSREEGTEWFVPYNGFANNANMLATDGQSEAEFTRGEAAGLLYRSQAMIDNKTDIFWEGYHKPDYRKLAFLNNCQATASFEYDELDPAVLLPANSDFYFTVDFTDSAQRAQAVDFLHKMQIDKLLSTEGALEKWMNLPWKAAFAMDLEFSLDDEMMVDDFTNQLTAAAVYAEAGALDAVLFQELQKDFGRDLECSVDADGYMMLINEKKGFYAAKAGDLYVVATSAAALDEMLERVKLSTYEAGDLMSFWLGNASGTDITSNMSRLWFEDGNIYSASEIVVNDADLLSTFSGYLIHLPKRIPFADSDLFLYAELPAMNADQAIADDFLRSFTGSDYQALNDLALDFYATEFNLEREIIQRLMSVPIAFVGYFSGEDEMINLAMYVEMESSEINNQVLTAVDGMLESSEGYEKRVDGLRIVEQEDFGFGSFYYGELKPGLLVFGFGDVESLATTKTLNESEEYISFLGELNVSPVTVFYMEVDALAAKIEQLIYAELNGLPMGGFDSVFAAFKQIGKVTTGYFVEGNKLEAFGKIEVK